MKRLKNFLKLSWLNKIEIFLIKKVYQSFFSPFIGNQCRFAPTCSNYGIDCLKKYGFFKANFKMVGRILRCNPFFKGGFDPA